MRSDICNVTRSLVTELRKNADELKARKGSLNAREDGLLFGYMTVLSLLQKQAEAYPLDKRIINLNKFDAEREYL